jgi:hypothetical protein
MESRQQLNQEHYTYQQQLWVVLANFSRVFKIDERPGKNEKIMAVLMMVVDQLILEKRQGSKTQREERK